MGNGGSVTHHDWDDVNSQTRYNEQLAKEKKGVSSLEVKKNVDNSKYQQNETQLRLLKPRFASLDDDVAGEETEIARLDGIHKRGLHDIDSTYDGIKDMNLKIPVKTRVKKILDDYLLEIDGIKTEIGDNVTNLGMDQAEYEKYNLMVKTKYYDMIHRENENVVDALRDFQSELKQNDKAFLNEQTNNDIYYYPLFALLITYYIVVVVFIVMYIYADPFKHTEYYYKYPLYLFIFILLVLYPHIIYPIEKVVINYSWWFYCLCFNQVYSPLDIFPR
jgi:hypothetical protein